MDCTEIPQIWPEIDWDNLFTEPEEIQKRESESECKAKKRKRMQSIAFSEKKRRKQMSQFLATLKSIIPIPTSKAAKYCLIEETIKYIEKLYHRLQELQGKKEQLLARKSCHDDNGDVGVEVSLYGNEIIIRITSFKMPENLSDIYRVIEVQHFTIQTADIYRGDCIVILSFCAH
ncbi:hypothetical protein KI387_030726, partial [Taxus chinensis]